MAGAGPPPKPAGQRRRRNATPGKAQLPAAGRRGPAPKLPGASTMLSETRAWWKLVWASPAATRWVPADLPNLHRLARLHDLVARQFRIVADGPIPHMSERQVFRLADLISGRAPDAPIAITFESPVQAPMLAEIRQLEDRLGLTPMARLRLGWEIAEDDDAGAAATEEKDELAERRARFERAVS